MAWMTDLLQEWIYPDYLGDFGSYTVLLWVLTLFIITFSPSLIMFSFVFLSNLLLHIYKRKNKLRGDYLSKSWDNGRRAVSYLWDIYGIVWHGKLNFISFYSYSLFLHINSCIVLYLLMLIDPKLEAFKKLSLSISEIDFTNNNISSVNLKCSHCFTATCKAKNVVFCALNRL